MAEHKDKRGIYVGKSSDATEENRRPPIYLSYIDQSGDFKKLASCWKTKKGDGYMCRLAEGVSINIQDVGEVNKQFEDSTTPSGDEINEDDIPF